MEIILIPFVVIFSKGLFTQNCHKGDIRETDIKVIVRIVCVSNVKVPMSIKIVIQI